MTLTLELEKEVANGHLVTSVRIFDLPEDWQLWGDYLSGHVRSMAEALNNPGLRVVREDERKTRVRSRK